MSARIVIAFIVAMSASAFCQEAQCSPNLAQYVVFSADLNGDGVVDILAKPIPEFVPIPLDDDLSIPIQMPLRSPPLLMLSNGANGYALSIVTDSAILQNPIWQPAPYNISYGDLLGNGVGSMVLQAWASNLPSFTIARPAATVDPYLVQHLTPQALGFNIDGSNISASLADQNGDGRSDLLISINGVIAMVLIAAPDGTFQSTPAARRNNSVASVSAIWGGFVTAVSKGGADTAIQYLSPEAQEAYSAALLNAGPALSGVSTGVTGQDFIAVQDAYVTTIVQRVEAGVTMSYPVTYSLTESGWKILSF